MSKWMVACGVALLSGIHLQGDEYSLDTSKVIGSIDNFPLNVDQEWFTKETYLILKPYLDDVDYANRLHSKGAIGATVDMSMKLEKPDFDWYSGVRLGLGRYLPNHDNWDLTLFTTYFYAEEKDKSTPNASQGTVLNPLWIASAGGQGVTKGSVQWLLNYFTWDLSAGREFGFQKTVVVHPFIGLRAALIYKKYTVRYSDQFFASNQFSQVTQEQFRSNDNFWGIGPRAGVDFQFKFKQYWALLGSFTGALFYGQYSVKEKIIFHRTVKNASHFADDAKASNASYCVRTNLEGSLGLGWESWVRHHTVRVAPSILFEASEWFDANQLFTANTSATDFLGLTLPKMRRHFGDLGLVGFSVNLQIDF